MGIASLILGIIAILISLTIFQDLSLILAVLALVLGVISLFKKENKGMCIAGIILAIISFISVFSTDTATTETSADNIVENLKVGDTWTVDGQWNLTINSVTTTKERNEFEESSPEQVIYITYTYENIGYEDKNGIMDGLYIDLDTSGDATIVDEQGEIAYSYPNDIKTYPTETPVGAKCKNAQVCIGLNNKSETITLTINELDDNGQKQIAKYTLDVD